MPPKKKVPAKIEVVDSDSESDYSEEEEEKVIKKPVKLRTEDVKYLKLTQHEQILLRPTMWVGSNEPKTVEHWVRSENRIEKKVVTFTDAGVRVFMEPLSNAMDNISRSKEFGITCSEIRITLDEKTGETSIYNDGKAITLQKYVEITKEGKKIEHDYYQQQLIFGELNSGSNYDDTEEKLTSGQNGLGVKLLNVFSKEFKVESYDPKAQKVYTQKWSNNMYKREEPVIKKLVKKGLPKDSGYTKVTWTLDFEKLGLTHYTDDIVSIYMKYVCDVAMIASKDNVSVYYNDDRVEINSLKDYAFLYFEQEPTDYIVYTSPDCNAVLLPWDEEEFMHMSFVNGICTYNGGVHVDKWAREILNPVADKINGIKTVVKPKKEEGEKKVKKTKMEKEQEKLKKEKEKKKKEKAKEEKTLVELKDVKKYFALFVDATLPNPKFDSQEKTKLTGTVSKVEVTVKTKKTDLGKIMKWEVIDLIKEKLASKNLKQLNAINKGGNSLDLKCLDDANFVKSRTKSKGGCILCAVEGNSARAFVIAGAPCGINGKVGRDYIGILTCKGNFLNPRDNSDNPREGLISRILKNKEATAMIRAFNLCADVDYTDPVNVKTLRYEMFMAVSDADEDGKHICGLWYNFFDCINPTILKIPGFFNYMRTPVVIINVKEVSMARVFYFTEKARAWLSTTGKKIPASKISRNKGLGAFQSKDVSKYFAKKIVNFTYDDDSRAKLNAIFGKGKVNSNRRKVWLGELIEDEEDLDSLDSLNITIFLDQEMKDFSKDHCRRGIPSVFDGFTESQRKIVYTAFLRNLKKKLKVAQFAGSVAERSAYHHGETILYNTIIHMAQRHVGSNNISLFYPDGNFGTRDKMGADASSGRYIFTHLDKLTRLIYRQEDEKYIPNVEDDGQTVEKEFYIPIIPMVLVNGSMGIGTGWSTLIPCFNPLDIIAWIKDFIDRGDDDLVVPPVGGSFHPWYRGFKGTIVPEYKSGKETGSYLCFGKMDKVKDGVYRVTEIPVGTNNWSIDDYRVFLDKLEDTKQILKYEKHSGSNLIDFLIYENSEGLSIDLSTEKSTAETFSRFKLLDRINTSNMVAFTTTHKTHDTFRRYNTVDQIMEEFCDMRLKKYDERLTGDIKETEYDIKIMKCRIRFIGEVNDGTIVLKKLSDVALDAELVKKKYLRNTKESKDNDTPEKEGESDDEKDEKDENEENDEDDEVTTKPLHGYHYLVDMKYRSATKAKLELLNKELEKLEDRLKMLNALTPKTLWSQELELLEKEYVIWEEKANKEMFSQTVPKDSKKISKTTKKK